MRSERLRAGRALAGISAVAMLLAACGADADSQDATTQDGGDANSAEAPSFTVGFLPAGIPTVAFYAALDQMREDGYEIDTAEVAEAELLVAGIVNDEFQFSSESTTAALLGAQNGGDVELIADLTLNSWTLYSTSDITECADLDGKRLAIHGQAGVSTAMVRNYIANECPGTEPEYMVIPGSPNRYAALLAGEIDASPLELADAISLENEAGDEYTMLTSFAESLSEVHPTSVYGSGQWMEENPEATTALLVALIEQNRQIAEDPEYLKSLIQEYVGEQPNIDEVAERYSELFPTDGGLTEEAVQATIDFGVDAEAIQPGLTVEEAADLSYLQAALEELG